MKPQLKIDFISDVMCPWCALGLQSFVSALEAFDNAIDLRLSFQPFELAPDMPKEGELTRQHLMRKYGLDYNQVVANQARITEMGEALGFTFKFNDQSRKWNTFDTHRVLYGVGLNSPSQQLALKQALLKAYFSENLNPADHDLIIQLSASVGVDKTTVEKILQSDLYSKEVRDIQERWRRMGVSSVPTLIINDQYQISGCQPVEQYQAAISQITGLKPLKHN